MVGAEAANPIAACPVTGLTSMEGKKVKAPRAMSSPLTNPIASNTVKDLVVYLPSFVWPLAGIFASFGQSQKTASSTHQDLPIRILFHSGICNCNLSKSLVLLLVIHSYFLCFAHLDSNLIYHGTPSIFQCQDAPSKGKAMNTYLVFAGTGVLNSMKGCCYPIKSVDNEISCWQLT